MRTLALALLALLLVPATAGAAKRKPGLRIHVVSNRADLISAGDALVRIERRAPIKMARIRVTAGGRDVTRAFRKRRNGRIDGLLTGLKVGPADVDDRCSNVPGVEEADGICTLDAAQTRFGTPATVAGESIATDTNKCALKPLRRSDYYPKEFTDAQWAQLVKAFPGGVCDWSNPGVEQQATIPWQTYQDRRGRVVYGGRSLGRAPKRSGGGWASGAFSGWRAAKAG